VKTRQSSSSSGGDPASLPDADSLAALRAWYEGIPAREAVALYLGQRKADGVSSRGILSRVRGQLVACARRLHREDLASLFVHAESERATRARAVAKAIALLPTLVPPVPLIGDDVAQWLPPRAA